MIDIYHDEDGIGHDDLLLEQTLLWKLGLIMIQFDQVVVDYIDITQDWHSWVDYISLG